MDRLIKVLLVVIVVLILTALLLQAVDAEPGGCFETAKTPKPTPDMPYNVYLPYQKKRPARYNGDWPCLVVATRIPEGGD